MIELLASGEDLIDPLTFNFETFRTSIWALGIFLVVLFVLKKAAWGPIIAGLDAREQRIAKSLDDAAEIERQTAELADVNQATLDAAHREAQGIVAQSREVAAAAAAEIQANAAEEIEEQRQRFKREMRLESQKAGALLRQDAVELTILASARLLGRALDSSDHRRLVEEALADAEDVARN